VTDWERIVLIHRRLVFHTARRILGHVADAEDVVQEVFLQAHRMQQTTVIRCWEGLLRWLAACRALDQLRQRCATVPLDDLSLVSEADAPEAVAIERELSARLRQAIERLPRREAAVFCLHYFDDLSHAQIADTLQIRPGAVATALHRARARLETLLAAA
jgi:RNA polymerase sigma-70 factor (ECF subfamily)